MLKVRVINGLIVGTFMSFIMSGVITAANTGIGPGFLARWLLYAFPLAWAMAVPLAVVICPPARALAERLAGKAALPPGR